jgi:hypothetical protein
MHRAGLEIGLYDHAGGKAEVPLEACVAQPAGQVRDPDFPAFGLDGSIDHQHA